MAALSITVANVLPGTGALYIRGIAGETITAGMSCYLKAADNKWYKADANLSAEAAGSGGLGISAHAALAGQPINIQTSGIMAFGAILTVGETYFVGASVAGDINPAGDVASGWYPNQLGVALTTSNLQVNIYVPGVAHG